MKDYCGVVWWAAGCVQRETGPGAWLAFSVGGLPIIHGVHASRALTAYQPGPADGSGRTPQLIPLAVYHHKTIHHNISQYCFLFTLSIKGCIKVIK